MLERRGDYVSAVRKSAQNGKVKRTRAVIRKYYAVAVFKP